jgi:alanine-synthesizing transaminase
VELELQGHNVLKCNIGNPGAFGFEAPQVVLDAIKENVGRAVPYEHQKGLPEARAVLLDKYRKIVEGGPAGTCASVTMDDIYIGNGVSELIMMSMRALLNPGDEVLIPSPDYPLWTAAVLLHGGVPVYYDCPSDNGFLPQIENIRSLVTARTRAIVIVNPNNPTGVIYPEELLQDIADMAEEYPFGGIVVFTDEIYDTMLFDGSKMTYMSSLISKTLCCSFGGLSKVYRACGFRVGWMVTSGDRTHAQGYLNALNMLSGLRLCANVPGQYGVKPAVEGFQSISQLTAPGGRLYEARKLVMQKVAKSHYMTMQEPKGAMYAFVKVNLPDFDDQLFALDLLETKHVLIAPGSSFNVEYKDHFRITLLPPLGELVQAMDAIEQVLSVHAAKQEATKQEALRILKAIRGSEDSGRIEELQRKASL